MAKKETTAAEQPAEESDALYVELHQSRLLQDNREGGQAVVVFDPGMPQLEGIGYRVVKWLKTEEDGQAYKDALAGYLEAGCDVEFAVRLTETSFYEGVTYTVVECPQCKGTGSLPGQDICFRCSGRGVVAA